MIHAICGRAELCRLLNSTPFGTVISERQLYRHRVRAGYRLGDENKIDLLRYVEWLVEEVHRPRATTPSEDYAAMKERSRARNAAIAKAGRDIGEVPAVVGPMLHQSQRNELRRRVVEDDAAQTMSSAGNRSESKRWLD